MKNSLPICIWRRHKSRWDIATVLIRILGLLVKSYPFIALSLIKYAEINRQSFPAVETRAGYCYFCFLNSILKNFGDLNRRDS